MYDFEYVKPGSVADAVAALQSEEATAMSGGQSLLPTMKARLAQHETVVDLTGCLQDSIRVERDGDIFIGGGTRHAAVARDSVVPGWLADVAAHIGDPAVRNRGTIGGSLANNDPAACYPAVVLATGATITTNTRSIAADDYFQGMFTTALEEGEIITEVMFPTGVSEPGRVFNANYQKFVQPASRFALVGVCVAQTNEGVRVAVTGASEDGVFRWTDAEAALSANFSADAVPPAPPADGMLGDIHGTPEYRAHIIHVMTKRAVIAMG
ncbi:MAG: xanthine dehydrogenase family protein subunit M [Pseudomonadota bacterium]